MSEREEPEDDAMNG